MVRKWYKKVYQRKFTNKIKEAIEKFCLEGPVSVTLLEAEHSRKTFLKMSLKDATEAFNSSGYINRKISVSGFRTYVPKTSVKLQGKIPLNSCLCEVCANFKLFPQALSGVGLKEVPGVRKIAVREIMCPHSHLLDD